MELLKSSYKDYLEAEFVDSKDRLMDLKQLAKFAERYTELDKFLAEATLQESFRDIESSPNPSIVMEGRRNLPPLGKGEGRGGVSKIVLSTIHQAKGLEWDAVFILNLSSGAFPNERAAREQNGLEEERRLFYVAITRAKKYLHLTYPMAGGSYGDFLSGPSPFLEEIEPGLLDDRSLLNHNATVFNRGAAEIEYVDEDKPLKIKPAPRLGSGSPRSFLRSLEDL